MESKKRNSKVTIVMTSEERKAVNKLMLKILKKMNLKISRIDIINTVMWIASELIDMNLDLGSRILEGMLNLLGLSEEINKRAKKK